MLLNEKFMVEAEKAAQYSSCKRRKYGVIITGESPAGDLAISTGWNATVGRCCVGECVRDRLEHGHAAGIEVGAEIHAEMKALIDLTPNDADWGYMHFYLAGFDRHNNQLLGKSCRPCHMCAMMIKYAGFHYVITRDNDNSLVAVSIDEIIEDHEQTYQPLFTL